MPKNVLITGVSGSGKMTVSEVLRAGGHRGVDLDECFSTMYYKDSKLPVDTDFQNHDLAWVKSVEWLCDIKRLRELLAMPGQIFCCGSADNIDQILPLFDLVALLHIDDVTLKQRLTHRTNNDWWLEADVQDWLLEKKKEYEESILKHGAVVIDAHQEVQRVVSEILTIANA